ncbi:MAG: hypothetical protein JWM53_1601 [bacterium]|nr:hypothetical protein [bacterium]
MVLVNRESVLTEQPWQEFAGAHGFRVLAEDSVATNPALAFRVQTFEPTADFKPNRPYVTRVLWRDNDGNDHSKLLVTKAVDMVAIAVKGEAANAPSAQPDSGEAHVNAAKRTARRRCAAAPVSERT